MKMIWLVPTLFLIACATRPTAPVAERCPASASGECRALFEAKPIAQVYESRFVDLYQAMGQANLRFPQIGNGINIFLLAKFLEAPMPIDFLRRDPPAEMIDKQYEAMLRAHKAYGIDKDVSREQVLQISVFFRDRLRMQLARFVEVLEPNLMQFHDGDALVEAFFSRANPQSMQKSAEVAGLIRRVLGSEEMIEAGKSYRESLRGRAGQGNGVQVLKFFKEFQDAFAKAFPESERDQSLCRFLSGKG